MDLAGWAVGARRATNSGVGLGRPAAPRVLTARDRGDWRPEAGVGTAVGSALGQPAAGAMARVGSGVARGCVEPGSCACATGSREMPSALAGVGLASGVRGTICQATVGVEVGEAGTSCHAALDDGTGVGSPAVGAGAAVGAITLITTSRTVWPRHWPPEAHSVALLPGTPPADPGPGRLRHSGSPGRRPTSPT